MESGLQSVLLGIAGGFPKVYQDLKKVFTGYVGSQNVYGENQLKIDVSSNNLFLDLLKNNPHVASLASEELENQEEGPASAHGGTVYSVAFDPLDGSSLVDVNLSVGSIFGIYRGPNFIGRKGNEQVAAIIAVYGPRLTFAVTVGQGTVGFLYNEETKEFVFDGELKVAEEKKMFAPGNLRACSSEKWYVELMEFWALNGYTLRYSGGMVPDVFQILKKGGGVFTYPGYKEKPQGKLRLLYECAPMAFLMEQAGGAAAMGASAGGAQSGRILDIVVEKLDQKTPIFLGSKKEVELAVGYMK